jgi:hypothetical protein
VRTEPCRHSREAAGGTVSNIVSREAIDRRTPVELIASTNLGQTEFKIMTFTRS